MKTDKYKNIRWVAVFPGALLAGFLATFPLHWLLYLAFAHNGTILGFIELPEGTNVFIERMLYPFVIAFVFIYTGFEIAPRQKFKAAIVLAILYITFAVGAFILGTKNGLKMSLGIRILSPILGLFLAIIIAWKKSKYKALVLK